MVAIFFGAIMYMYLQPTAHASFQHNKLVSLLNTIITPLLNPFIYTIRNKEVKDALRKAVRRKLWGVPSTKDGGLWGNGMAFQSKVR